MLKSEIRKINEKYRETVHTYFRGSPGGLFVGEGWKIILGKLYG